MSEAMSDSTGHAEALLAHVRLLRDKYDALAAANGENFNIFTLLGRETDEVRTHSAILADLLDPHGSHGQGVAFARLFAPQIGLREDELGWVEVQVEAAIDARSRIDILIETDRSYIVIENKIRAGDRDRQLKRYHDIAKARGKEYFKVFYLTLWGDPATKESLDGLSEDDVELISYARGVLDWLDDCIKEVALVPQIREMLSQYRATVRKLTGKAERNLSMELNELLKAKQGESYNFQLAPAIAQAFRQLSIEVEWTFWQKLRDGLHGYAGSGWQLALDEGQQGGSDWFKTVSEQIVGTAHSSARKKWDYGWTFRICSERSSFASGARQILLRVECEAPGWVFFGLAAVEQTGGERKWCRRSADDVGLFEGWAPWLADLPEAWRTGYGWLGWRYPTPHVQLYKTSAFTLVPDVMERLLKEGAVDRLVSEIKQSVGDVVLASTGGRAAQR